jgi:Na+-driven multidrug efflux pump
MIKDDDGKHARDNTDAIRRNCTKGSISGSLWGLAWPVIVSSTVMMMGPIIGTIWIGKLGSSKMAGRRRGHHPDAVSSVIIFYIYFKTGRWKRKKV